MQPNAPTSTVPALIEQYLPGLRNLARRMAQGLPHDELLADTIIALLHRQASFRLDGGFWNWASLIMRDIARQKRNRAMRAVQTAPLEVAWAASTPPSQEYAVDLGTVLAHVGGVLLRRAAGDKLQEIANDRGVSRERVRQIEVMEREALKKAVGW